MSNFDRCQPSEKGERSWEKSGAWIYFYFITVIVAHSVPPPPLWVQGCGVTKGWVVSFLPLPLCGFCVRIHGRRYPFGCLIIHLCSPVSIFLLCYLLFSQAVGGWVFGEKVFLSFRAGSFLASRKLKMA